jgi:rRNA-processing protein FCF1
MATNRDLLKEAIADAKAVKEAAIANAKVALEEAFTPFLKERLALTLSEMDEDLDEAITETDELEEYLNENPEEMTEEEMTEKEMTEGEMDLEELLRELEEDSDIMYEEEITEAKESEDSEEVTLEDMTEDDLKALIEDVISDMIEAGELEAGEGAEGEEMSDEEGMSDEEEVDLDELLYEIKKEKMKKIRPSTETEELEEAKKKAKKAEMEKEKIEEELQEALRTIKSIQSSLQEVKLLNAKLLYTNKIFNSRNLTEDQRIKVLTSFDKATSVKEAKLVYETLLEGLKTKRTPLKESIVRGLASKTINSPVETKKPIFEVDNQFARWQVLAGIKKIN